jgi:UDP-glucose 6-dehydrogenase
MNVVMIGAGYVGLVSGACFAEFGARVTCVDKQEARIDALRRVISRSTNRASTTWWRATPPPGGCPSAPT